MRVAADVFSTETENTPGCNFLVSPDLKIQRIHEVHFIVYTPLYKILPNCPALNITFCISTNDTQFRDFPIQKHFQNNNVSGTPEIWKLCTDSPDGTHSKPQVPQGSLGSKSGIWMFLLTGAHGRSATEKEPSQ